MSYCRCSSNDFQCDVYIYENVSGGFTTHVAARKHVFKEPLPDPVPWSEENCAKWMDRHAKVMSIVKYSELVPIGLTEDGVTFNDPDAASAADRLQWLKDIGYRVPQYAIDTLREEAKEK